MAEVGTVFDATAAPRTSADILPVDDTERAQIHPGPVTSNKWLTASVVADAASVVAQIFAEADRRDPDHDRTWVALVDGNNHQIDRITAEAHARTLQVTIVIDFIHVLEYIWKAAWCFHREGDPAAEEWVRHHARAVLDGKATRVAGSPRRRGWPCRPGRQGHPRRRGDPATRVALPSRTARAWWRTHSSAAGSPSRWKHHAAFQMYSRT